MNPLDLSSHHQKEIKDDPSSLTLKWVLDHLNQGQDVSFKVRGHSMRPFLYDSDRVTLCPKGPFLKGDLVLVIQSSPSQLFYIHRLHWIFKHRIWTKGDSLPYLDSSQPLSSIVGKVIHIDSRRSSSSYLFFKYSHTMPNHFIFRSCGILWSWIYTLTALLGLRRFIRCIKGKFNR